MSLALAGRARVLGNDINTDYIITSARKRDTPDEQVLKQYLLETLDPGFAASVQPGDVLVGGRNFGCGSAMEIAVTVILAAGIRAVLAKTFARTFYRNAINNGLIPVPCDTSGVREGDRIEVEFDAAGSVITNLTTGLRIVGEPMPGALAGILEAGGLVRYLAGGASLTSRRRDIDPPIG